MFLFVCVCVCVCVCARARAQVEVNGGGFKGAYSCWSGVQDTEVSVDGEEAPDSGVYSYGSSTGVFTSNVGFVELNLLPGAL